MKILITGAFGNVGLALIEKLVKLNHQIRIFELKNYKNWVKSLKFQKQAEIHWGNLLNYKEIKKAVKDVDVVIHLAAIIPPLADINPQLAYSVNVDGTKNIIKAIESIPSRKRPCLLYTSSIAIYGDRRNNPHITVNDPLKPNDEYGKQKLEAEIAIRNANLTWAVFRLTYITAIESLKMNPLMFEMPLNTKIEICDPADVAQAIIHGVETSKIWGNIYNIAGGKSCRTTYGEYLENMMRLFGMGGKFPETAFSENEFHCGWLEDSSVSNEVLDYQSHTINDFYKTVKKKFSTFRFFISIFRPIARRYVLGYSKYYRKKEKSQISLK